MLLLLGHFGPWSLWNPFQPAHKTLSRSPLEQVWWCRPRLITADVILENCPKTHKGSATKCPQLTAAIQTTLLHPSSSLLILIPRFFVRRPILCPESGFIKPKIRVKKEDSDES